MKVARRTLLLFAALLISAGRAATQQPPQPAQAAPLAQPVQEETYDPLHAQKAVEVGEFYMKKGDVDAAIERFQDAIRLRSNFARPRLLLGEAYEKKGEKAEAAKYYKEYLAIVPKAPDAAKIRKKIEKLTRETR